MGITFPTLYFLDARKVLLVMSVIAAGIIVFELFELPSASYMLSLVPVDKFSAVMMIRNATTTGDTEPSNSYVVAVVDNSTNLGLETGGKEMDYDLTSYDGRVPYGSLELDKDAELDETTYMEDEFFNKILRTEFVRSLENVSSNERAVKSKTAANKKVDISRANVTVEYNETVSFRSAVGEILNQSSNISSMLVSPDNPTASDADSRYAVANMSMLSNLKQVMETKLKDKLADSLKTMSFSVSNNSAISGNFTVNRRKRPISISQMYTLLVQGFVSTGSMWLSKRDRELVSAKLHIMNAPTVSITSGLYAPLFRNISMFMRSYDLMDRILKVYIYREGEKPIFHQPKLGGIYASEGWFMKLMEGNKHFVVKDPRKAHLFYIPLSSKMLRVAFNHSPPGSMETYLRNYVDLIAGKYNFWNRTEGTDHFLVACHDWAPKLTSWLMRNCVRALCNANVAKDFRIGEDTALPVTFVRKAEDPLKDLGGETPSRRPILAFFAGSMHGYLRPKLLKYWENKHPDMKISGPMPRDSKGKQNYREHMRSSKYCICARGYEVHTPRVVEAILAECVPVIISDNYFPPFLEVLDWEAFSVFIPEKDVPKLRTILLSIPEVKYLQMQLRVKMVQRHFLWHKKPEKYDLFHMILHSIWYNRVFQLMPR